MKTSRKPDLMLILGVLVFAIFGLPSLAFAWGPSVHLWIGDTLIQTIGASLPMVAALLRRHAKAYLYGCVAPDIYVGKGSKYHDDHCHNWSTGKKLLTNAKSEREQAFALGYMTHLAADIIGHNYFVPNNLYRTFGVHKFGHVYYELHADNLLDPSYVDLAHSVVRDDQDEPDRLLNTVIRKGLLPFGSKKKIFSSWLAISNHNRFKKMLARFRGYSDALLRHDDVREMIDLSLAAAFEMLKNTGVPVVGKYDPIGAENIRLAKELRKNSKRSGSYKPSDVPFPIPAELRALRMSLVELSLPEGNGRTKRVTPELVGAR